MKLTISILHLYKEHLKVSICKLYLELAVQLELKLAKALKNYTKEIRLVSRNPKKVNESDELMVG